MQLVQQRLKLVVGNIFAGALCAGSHNSRRLIAAGDKLTLAMQLIQQGFKFVIGDFIAGGRSDRSSHWSRRSLFCRGDKLPLAMQLVQQRFEFVIGDFIT